MVKWADDDIAVEHEALAHDDAEVDLDESNEVVGDPLLRLVELVFGLGQS
jgi:hypothetical protein